VRFHTSFLFLPLYGISSLLIRYIYTAMFFSGGHFLIAIYFCTVEKKNCSVAPLFCTVSLVFCWVARYFCSVSKVFVFLRRITNKMHSCGIGGTGKIQRNKRYRLNSSQALEKASLLHLIFIK
jgi:hypothetical protein